MIQIIILGKHTKDDPTPTLTEEQQQDPYIVLDDFFEDNSLPELRSTFKEVLETCLATDVGPFRQAEKRAVLISLFHKLQALFEANYLITKMPQSTDEE